MRYVGQGTEYLFIIAIVATPPPTAIFSLNMDCRYVGLAKVPWDGMDVDVND